MKYKNQVINDFGKEWSFFTQKNKNELSKVYNQYFNIFPWEIVNKNSIGFDMGCGSGRWAQFVSPNVKLLNCIEPSYEAIRVAKKI